MFALRRQLLVPSSTGRVAEFRGPIAISVPTTSTSQGDDDGGRHQQVRRWYGRTCPAVRRHALRKKRAAATENAAASAKSGVATMGKNATTSSGGGSSSSTATFATSSSVLLDEAKNTNNDRPGTLAAKAASIVNLNNLKISQGGPTMEIAQSMPIDYAHMDNISLLTLSAMRNEKARGEMLRRHIMVVDNVSYKEACITFKKIEAENRKGMKVHTIPYKMGIMAAGGAAFCSIPLCFHLPTVEWFNEFYVTTDVPPPEDLETWLEGKGRVGGINNDVP